MEQAKTISEVSFVAGCFFAAPFGLPFYKPYILGTAITFEYEVPSIKEFRARQRLRQDFVRIA